MRLKVLLAVACVLVTIQTAVAQVPIGTISGRVLDQSGQAVPGVTVTATSPALQGARDAVTTAAGDYLLPLLPPGAYTVRYELTGFETVTRMIAVAATQAVPMDVALAVARVGEAVTVTAEASPFVQTAQVATNINQDLAATLPTSRSMVASVLLAPNVKASGPGGTQGADGALAISGAMSFDSIYMINGVAVTENLRGQPFNLFIEDALQETTVATAGVSAEYGRFGGGIVNAITKSGGNRLSGSFRDSFNNDSWRTTTPFKETRLDKTIPTYEYTLGGPVARDRIWFFTAGRIRNSEDARQTFVTNISYPRRNEEKRFEGKITSSLTPNHSVRGSYLKITQLVVNNIFQNGMDLRSLFNQGQPQDLLSLNYNGIFGRSLTIEGQYSSRHFAISGAGAPSTDLVEGTLLVDRSRGSAFRYWAPTFCAVCGDEHRDNTEALAKATYFLSSDRLGTHTIVFGYDGYNDHRFANNHQSGSDFRILGTSTIVDGATIYPVFNGTNNSTIVQWNPIAMSSNGTDLLTHSVFVNDSWRAGSRVTLNLGLRFDRNAGEDAANNQTSTSRAFSPRLGVVWDPRGDQKWAITSSFARYVSALNSAIAENSPAGNPATYTWFYQGPSVNVDTSGPLVGPEAAIKQVFDWLDANGGTSRTFTTADVPGVNTFVDTTLESPSSYEYAAGVSRSFPRGSVRADYVFRDFKDFYATRTDLTTGRVTNSLGVDFDVNLIGNSDLLTRRYQGVTAQGVYRLGDSAELGSSYTLSRLWGNFDGETSASGPVTAGLLSYPEYRETSWNQPTGDLFGDQRHRGRAWGIYRVPMAEPHGSADLGLLFTAASGVPLGGAGLAVGQIDPRPYVVNPGYAKPLGTATTIDDFFFPRDRFRTEAQYRTDVSMNYSFRFAGGVQAFFHGDVLNIFNQFQLCGCGGTVFDNGGGSDVRNISTNVLTASTTASLQPFNPFTTAPVEGVNYQRASNFGQATNRFAYTSPRTFRFNIGVRF